MSAAPTVDTLLAAARRSLRAAGVDGAAIDARALACGILALDAAGLIAAAGSAVAPDQAERLAAAVARRAAGEPVGRILGRREFHGLEFRLGPDTLEPRPDTETLVDVAIARVRRGAVPGVAPDGAGLVFADLGTGTGAIAIALAVALPGARGVAVDLSAGAAAVARDNAERTGVADRLDVRVGSWLDPVPETLGLVLSNPPYIESAAIPGLDREVRDHDPRLALDGGPDGLDAYRALVPAAAARLVGGGTLAVEIGWTQGAAVSALFADAGFRNVAVVEDLGGRPRVVVGAKA